MSDLKELLYDRKSQRSVGRLASQAAFPLGGIGTGNFSIGARGEMRDWEIKNSPAKGGKMPYTFFAVHARQKDKEPITKILESRIISPYHRSLGADFSAVAGLPRFAESKMSGKYPFVNVELTDPDMPITAELEAFTPLIPLDVDNSSLPAAIMTYTIRNISETEADVSLIGSMANVVGLHDVFYGWFEGDNAKTSENKFRAENSMTGVYMTNLGINENSREHGDISIAVDADDVISLPYLRSGEWADGITLLWADFCEDGQIDPLKYEKHNTTGEWRARLGVVGGYATLQPGEEKAFKFIISWNFPNRLAGWGDEKHSPTGISKNYYSTKFENSWEVNQYIAKNYDYLYSETKKFHDAIFNSTLPWYVKDALVSNITVIRSTTCFRLSDGKFFGWEGCFETLGSCWGNCTHVWNYAHTMAFLFPELERDMRDTEFNYETDESGNMSFRTTSLFAERWKHYPAADGQLGCIIRLYRDWKLCGDNEFLKSVWDGAKRALDFAFTNWDSDGDFVLDSQQHNTYDIEFYGPNSMINSMFFGALKAAAEMAVAMGEPNVAAKYREALEKGSAKMDELLWNGEYYCQKTEDVNEHKYQYGDGCLSDQLFGQLQAHVAGVGYILPEEHVKSAIHAVFKHNFLTDFTNVHNLQRGYAFNDETGLILCTWPNGGRPNIPFVYSDEVWTGIEYQVAAHLIFEGFVDEGLTIVKATRERHDGFRRNLWNEVECGNHYARSMASWGVLSALSGFKADMPNKTLYFTPKINQDDFVSFFSCGTAWGTFSQKKENDKFTYKVDVLHGNLDGVKIIANGEEI